MVNAITACPACLRGVAANEWIRITTSLQRSGLLTKLDIAALTIYCELVAIQSRSIAQHRRLKKRLSMAGEANADKILKDLTESIDEITEQLMELCEGFCVDSDAHGRMKFS